MKATSVSKVENIVWSGPKTKSPAEAITVEEASSSLWLETLQDFEDANLYQTWAYGSVRSGSSRVSRLIIKDGTEVIAVAQARLTLLSSFKAGIAYVLYGPLWKRRGMSVDTKGFRQAICALRSEYVEARGLALRMVPNVCDSGDGEINQIFADEGYLPTPRARLRRTIIMDLRASLEDLSRGLHQKWRYNLKKAHDNNLEILEGEAEGMFEIFERMYDEMKERKGLPCLTDLTNYRRIQEALPPKQKLRVFLCKSQGEFCAGGICSAMGNTGIYLFGATSDFGTQTYASYLTHWKMLEWIKSQGCQFYDLNGINSAGNAGGYQFKSQLAGTSGREVQLVGEFDAYPNALAKLLLGAVATLKATRRRP